MCDNNKSFKQQAESYMASSDWIVKKVDEIVEEFNTLCDDDYTDKQYLDDLYNRMEYLQRRLYMEEKIYHSLIDSNDRE